MMKGAEGSWRWKEPKRSGHDGRRVLLVGPMRDVDEAGESGDGNSGPVALATCA
jgi:hypothetical protein